MKKFVIGGALALAATVNPAWAQDESRDDENSLTHLVQARITFKDYPFKALRRHEAGRVAMRITVRSDGSVADCAVVESSGFYSLDRRGCEMARRRMRYTSWVPTAGVPHETIVMDSINWALGGEPQEPVRPEVREWSALTRNPPPIWVREGKRDPRIPVTQLVSGEISAEDYPIKAQRNGDEGRVVVGFLVRADGRVVYCAVIGSSGFSSLDSRSCEIVRQRFRYAPWSATGGRRGKVLMHQSIRWAMPDTREPASQLDTGLLTTALNESIQHPVPYENARFSISFNASQASRGRATDCTAEVHGAWFESLGDACALLYQMPAGSFSLPDAGDRSIAFHISARWNPGLESVLIEPAEGWHSVLRWRASFDLDATGAIVRCTLVGGILGQDMPETGCDGRFPPWRFEPPRSADGAPLETGQMTLLFIFESDRDLMPAFARARGGEP